MGRRSLLILASMGHETQFYTTSSPGSFLSPLASVSCYAALMFLALSTESILKSCVRSCSRPACPPSCCLSLPAGFADARREWRLEASFLARSAWKTWFSRALFGGRLFGTPFSLTLAWPSGQSAFKRVCLQTTLMHGVLFPRASQMWTVFLPCAGANRPSTPGAARTEYSLTRTKRVFIFCHACSLLETISNC